MRPNLLGLPKSHAVRRCFKPATGCLFVVADYAASQLRIVAAHVHEQRLIDTFNAPPPDDDPHRLTASLLLKKHARLVTDSERDRAKAANYGLLFGLGPKRFVAYAYSNYGLVLTHEEARTWREGFFTAYPAIATGTERQLQRGSGCPLQDRGASATSPTARITSARVSPSRFRGPRPMR